MWLQSKFSHFYLRFIIVYWNIIWLISLNPQIFNKLVLELWNLFWLGLVHHTVDVFPLKFSSCRRPAELDLFQHRLNPRFPMILIMSKGLGFQLHSKFLASPVLRGNFCHLPISNAIFNCIRLLSSISCLMDILFRSRVYSFHIPNFSYFMIFSESVEVNCNSLSQDWELVDIL